MKVTALSNDSNQITTPALSTDSRFVQTEIIKSVDFFGIMHGQVVLNIEVYCIFQLLYKDMHKNNH